MENKESISAAVTNLNLSPYVTENTSKAQKKDQRRDARQQAAGFHLQHKVFQYYFFPFETSLGAAEDTNPPASMQELLRHTTQINVLKG